MSLLPDQFYGDFSGGVRRDISPYLLKDNQLQKGRNFEIDEFGRIIKRRGSYQFGQDIVGLPLNIHHDPNGFLVANNASPSVVYRLSSGRLLSAITTASTTISITATPSPNFTASASVIEIEGDLINYGSYSDPTFSTVTNITSPHAAGASINQWISITALTSSDANDGAWFAYLNGITFILLNGDSTNTANLWQWNGSTASAVSGEPAGTRFLEVFRDRLFTVGNGAGAGVPTNRIFFSNLGDGTSWPSTVTDNSFDLEDTSGEGISGLKQYRENLMIWKPSSFYAYNGSLPVRQVSSSFGIHNENCVQEINGLLYGAGPNGIFVTNGSSVQRIDAPVWDYYQDYKFGFIANGSTVQSLFTNQWEDKFIIYIGDTTTVDTISDVALVYDTVVRSWEVWSGWTDPTMMRYLKRFRTDNLNQQRNAFFWGASTKVYRSFEDRHTEIDGSGLATTRGADIFAEMFSNTGSNIDFQVLTKPFDLGKPQFRKKFAGGYLKVFCESPQGMMVSVIIDDGDPIPLGKVKGRIERFKFPAGAIGNRCAILLDESSQVSSLVVNGFIFEDINTLDKNAIGQPPIR